MDPIAARTLLRSTRRLTVWVVVLLTVQLSGNLYEQVVSNAATISSPRAQSVVGELEPGSPLFFYLPWVPVGLALAVVLAVRLSRSAPAPVARRARLALAGLATALVAKVLLITQVNPVFRDPGVDPAVLREWAVVWAWGNGVAIVGVAAAIVLFLSWRPRLLDAADRSSPSADALAGRRRG